MTPWNSFVNKFNIVKQAPIFSKLSWLDIQKIARKVKLVEYKKGDIILKEGDPADFFYCVVSGRLEAHSTDKSGLKQNIDFIHRGMHFGIISVLTGETHTLSFEALNDSLLLQIPKDDFHIILESIPHLGIALSHSLSKRIHKNTHGRKGVFESTIISVYSPAEGTGSSTYAMNLAINLQAETKKKVILVDIKAFDVKDIDKASEFKTPIAPRWERPAIDLKDIVGDHERIFQSILKEELEIDLLHVMFDVDDESLQKQISPLVSTLVGAYHYVVVDLPNSMDKFVLEALKQSDFVHLMTKDHKRDLNMIRSVIDQLEEKFQERYQPDKIKIIVRSTQDKVYLSHEELSRAIDFDIYKIVPNITVAQLDKDVSGKSVTFQMVGQNSDYAKVTKQIAREIGHVMVGVVLGGGAALGVAHIGVIRVLEENNIPVDVVVGSSMGALVAAMWAIGNDAKGLEQIAREFEDPKMMLKLFDPVFPISGLIAGRLITLWLKKHLGEKTFYDAQFPLKIISYDLTRREDLVITSGSLVDAVRQSIAIPGVIRPVKRKERVIIDGGVLNPLPTNILVAAGVKKIIAVNVLQTPHDVSHGFDMEQHKIEKEESVSMFESASIFFKARFKRLLRKIFVPNIADIIVQTLQATEFVIAEQSAKQADVVIHPDLTGIQWFELNKVNELIRAGEEAARKHLPDIKKLIED